MSCCRWYKILSESRTEQIDDHNNTGSASSGGIFCSSGMPFHLFNCQKSFCGNSLANNWDDTFSLMFGIKQGESTYNFCTPGYDDNCCWWKHVRRQICIPIRTINIQLRSHLSCKKDRRMHVESYLYPLRGKKNQINTLFYNTLCPTGNVKIQIWSIPRRGYSIVAKNQDNCFFPRRG